MEQINETQHTQKPAPTSPSQYNNIHITPRWAAIVGLLALGVLYSALPEKLTIGPGWLPLAVVVILLLPLVLSRLTRRPLPHRTVRILAFIALGVVTLALIAGVVLLIITLPDRTQAQAGGLLRSAALLWISNILVFALWYWELDGGGPLQRHLAGHQAADFMFPQQADGNKSKWAPQFVDYLFVAFTSATALSPADTYPLTQQAKALMMIQAVISLTVIVLIAARAVNIL